MAISRKDWLLFCLAGAVAIILWLEPNRTPLVTVVGLLVLFVFLLIPVLNLPIIRNGNRAFAKKMSLAVETVIVGIGVFAYGIHVWPDNRLGMLTAREQDMAISVLKNQPHPIPVSIMCTPNEEREGAAGAQFIRLFGVAGWPLTKQVVEREINGSTHLGLYFVLHSTVDVDYSKPEFRRPNVGVWTKMQPAYDTAKAVFDKLGIKTDLVVGATFPEDVLGIYFGVGTAKR
jgi:hypothetical protein